MSTDQQGYLDLSQKGRTRPSFWSLKIGAKKSPWSSWLGGFTSGLVNCLSKKNTTRNFANGVRILSANRLMSFSENHKQTVRFN